MPRSSEDTQRRILEAAHAAVYRVGFARVGVGASGKSPVHARRRDGAERHGMCSAGRRQFPEPPGRFLGQLAGEFAGTGLMAEAGGLPRP